MSRARLVVAALLGVPALFAGCRCQSCSGSRSSGSASASASATASSAPRRKRSTHLTPLSGPAQRRLGDHGASVEVPVGATDSRPVLIVLSEDDSQATCRTWRGVSQGYGFVLCPALGPAKEGGAGPDIPATEKALRTSLHALRRRFGNYISPAAVVLAGLGPAARLALSLVKQEPAYFARVALLDGGFREWSSGVATIFARRGGKRALFVCTGPSCATPAGDAALLSRRAGAQARSVVRHDAGPEPAAPRSAFEWLIGDDADWKPPKSPPH